MVVFIVVFIILASVIVTYWSNKRLLNKIKSYKFHLLEDEKRNFDILVIGDNYNVELVNKNVYKNCLKYRSLYSSYLILRERFSLLREDGEGVVFIVARKNNVTGISPIDYINFHQITCKRLNCTPNRFRRKFPIASYVIWYLKQIFSMKKPNKMTWEELAMRINSFCNERNIIVEIIEL